MRYSSYRPGFVSAVGPLSHRCLMVGLVLLVLLAALPAAVTAESSWALVWNDEFNGSALDQTKWDVMVGMSPRNNEVNYYTADSVRLAGGNLNIQAQRRSYNGAAFTSGQIHTTNKFAFTYGKIEFRAKVPRGNGMHPALWMLGNDCPVTMAQQCNWPARGAEEIDVMEHVGHQLTTMHLYDHHGPAVNVDHGTGCYYDEGVDYTADFHVYSLVWEPGGKLTHYVDGVARCTAKAYGDSYFETPMAIIIDLAVGGNWPGTPDATTPFPAEFLVDYVRVYQSTSTSGSSYFGMNGGFEADRAASQQPFGWQTWSSGNYAGTDYSQTSQGAHGGSYHLTHAGSTAYDVYTYQRLAHLAPGTYSLHAWVRSSGGQSIAQMQVKGNGVADQKVAIPARSEWTSVTLDAIYVPNGTIEIGFYSVAGAGQWLHVDDVRFVKSGAGTGLRGVYYPNVTLTEPSGFTRTDAQVQFDWGTGSPGSPLGNDGFSVRWTGEVEAPVSGAYTFATTSDDGVRLWVNNALVIDNWTDHAPTANQSAAISLTAGQRYALRLEYYERGGGAVIRLNWSYPGQTLQAIPQTALYPAAAATTPVVTRIRVYPRSSFAARMVGGTFQGSTTSSTSGFVDLATISTQPSATAWTELAVSTTTRYRYLRYRAPAGSYGNVAEIAFYAGTQQLTGTVFGTDGSYAGSGNTRDKAFDGSTSTFFDAPSADGAVLGIDLGP